MRARLDIEPGELAQVFWFDAQGGQINWTPLAELPTEPTTAVSVGCVYANNKKAICLAQSMDTGNGNFDNIIVVPWPNVTKVMVISE